MKSIYIIRHVSGAGSSTLANQLSLLALHNPKLKVEICCADDFMVDDDGKYDFKREKLGYVHNKCKEKFLNAINDNFNLIIVNNTSVRYADFKYYLEMGEQNGYTIFVMVLENYHGNKDIHGCPDETLKRQEMLLSDSLKLR